MREIRLPIGSGATTFAGHPEATEATYNTEATEATYNTGTTLHVYTRAVALLAMHERCYKFGSNTYEKGGALSDA
jgi:hypothetical protein